MWTQETPDLRECVDTGKLTHHINDTSHKYLCALQALPSSGLTQLHHICDAAAARASQHFSIRLDHGFDHDRDGDSRTGGNPLLRSCSAARGWVPARSARVVGWTRWQGSALAHPPSREVIGRAMRRHNGLAHEGKRQRADELSRGVVVGADIKVIE